MYTIIARNVNEALLHGTRLLRSFGQEVSPRGKRTLEYPTPVTTVYMRPTERVLFCEGRDANPFLHLFESLWMLAGRNDARFMTTLVKRFSDYSDDGVSMQGSYGFRWRMHFGYDQLETVISLLRSDPSTRRAVLTMWDPQDLEERIASTDIPCNTQVYFKIRGGLLRMTVTNRSNDMLWGAYGANAVHMSLLQEYIANRVGVQVGSYTQMSDSFHVYLDGPGGKIWNAVNCLKHVDFRDDYYQKKVRPIPLGAGSLEWDTDLRLFFHLFDNYGGAMAYDDFHTSWWRHVVLPLWNAYIQKDPFCLSDCMADDWRTVAQEWFMRRAK